MKGLRIANVASDQLIEGQIVISTLQLFLQLEGPSSER